MGGGRRVEWVKDEHKESINFKEVVWVRGVEGGGRTVEWVKDKHKESINFKEMVSMKIK